MATNDPPGRSIIQQVQCLITENNFDLSICKPHLTQIQSDMNFIYKAYESVVEASEKKDIKLNRLRLRFEDMKLKIESLEGELVMSKDKCIILKEKCEITYSKRNILIYDNKRLNAKIDALHNSIDMLEANERMTHNICHPWSQAPGIGKRVSKANC